MIQHVIVEATLAVAYVACVIVVLAGLTYIVAKIEDWSRWHPGDPR